MAQVKMSYGIDLGTTNSSISKIENGKSIIIKTDVLKDTLPSCVSFTRKKIVRVGDGAYNNLRQDKANATKTLRDTDSNVFIEFKRTMGLNTQYYSSHMGRAFTSEELSSEVLKTLKSFVTDESVEAAVITIPAKFKSDQIAATKRAAELAGIKHTELLQEPIAAAIAFGVSSSQKEGHWLVFDFGGGTFDAALIKVKDGILQVQDTEGDNYLGGKNLDYAIVDEILIPHLKDEFSLEDFLEDENNLNILRDALKFYAESIKNQLSFKEKTDIQSQIDEFGDDDDGEPIELDIVVSQSELNEVLRPIFQKAVDITLDLIKRNGVAKEKIDSLILVGGPTHSPLLRSMLKEQVTSNVDSSADPMTAVAKGASLYAANIDSNVKQTFTTKTVALDVTYEANSVEDCQFVGIKLLPSESKNFSEREVTLEIVRGDKAWSSGRKSVGISGEIFECALLPGRANTFMISTYDSLGNPIPCFPKEITIIQGIVFGSAVLPYNIGIEAHNDSTERDEFVPLKGLEKNQSLPAIGVRNCLKTPKQIRPGFASDRLIVPIYQGEVNSAGSSADLNDHVFDLVITGEDLGSLVPTNSEVDITLKVDASQMVRAEVFFHVSGETVEKEVKISVREGITEDEVFDFLRKVESRLDSLRADSGIAEENLIGIVDDLDDITGRLQAELPSEDGRMHLLADIRRAALKLEKIEKENEWYSLKNKLDLKMEQLEKVNRSSSGEIDSEISSLRRAVIQLSNRKDLSGARELLKKMDALFFHLTFEAQLALLVRTYTEDFHKAPWKDPRRARELLNRANQMIRAYAKREELYPVVKAIIEELDLPEDEKIKI